MEAGGVGWRGGGGGTGGAGGGAGGRLVYWRMGCSGGFAGLVLPSV